jgi:protein O-mannosyl-transferase
MTRSRRPAGARTAASPRNHEQPVIAAPSATTPGGATHVTWTWADVGLALLVAAATLAVYAQVWHYDFVVYDDPTYVTANEHVRAGLTWSGLVWAFTAIHDANWFPLTWMSHMADVQWFGLHAGSHHLTNVLMHAASAVLLFAALRRMTGQRWPSALAAALFALHPLHVESVAWVAERKDVLSGLFWMVTLHGYAYYVGRPGRWRYLLVAAPFALGLLSKPMVVTLPFVLLLLDAWPLRRLRFEWGATGLARLLREKLPLLLLSAAIAVATWVAQDAGGAVVGLGRLPFGSRAANALVSYAAYIVSFLLPARLAAFYPFPSAIPWWQVGLSVAALVALSALVWRRATASPYLAVGWCWYVGTLVPVIGLVQVGSQARADRYTYLPGIGLSIMLAWGMAELAGRWPRARVWMAVLGAALPTACIALTWTQAQVWRNSETLFRHALAATADNYVATDGLGVVLGTQGRTEDAIALFEEAVRIKPDYAQSRANLGAALLGQGRAADALPHLLQAVRLNPTLREALVNLAACHRELGQTAEAAAAYEEVVRRQPDDAAAQSGLGMMLVARGREDEGIGHLRESVRIAPSSADGHYDLARALLGLGRAQEAALEFSETVRLRPSFAEAHFGLASILARQGRLVEAIAEYEAALRIAPQFAGARADLGSALATAGRFDEAIAQFREALRLQPGLADAERNLARAEEARRQLGSVRR